MNKKEQMKENMRHLKPLRPPLDVVPGSAWHSGLQLKTESDNMLNVSTNNRDNHSFVPCISALDLNVSDYYYNIAGDPNILDKTPFDAVYFQTDTNARHIRVDFPIRDLFLKEVFPFELQPDSLYLQNMTISDSVNYEASRAIFMGGDVTPANFPGRSAGDFEIATGGFVAMRAGEEIVFRNGTSISAADPALQTDAFHAYIDQTLDLDDVCTQSSFDNARIAANYDEESETVDGNLKENTNKGADLLLYPNPANGRVTAEARLTAPCGQAELILSRIDGSRVERTLVAETTEAGVTRFEFNVSHLPPGVLIVQLRTACETAVQKLVVQ